MAKALQMAKGLVLIGMQDPDTRKQNETLYSSSMACPDCGINVPRLEPRSFSFNSTYGACPECHGLGSIYDFDPGEDDHGLVEAAAGWRDGAGVGLDVSAAADQAGGGEVQDQPEAAVQRSDEGAAGPAAVRAAEERGRAHGLPRHLRYLRSNLDETKSEGYREYMMQYMSATTVPALQGPAAAAGVAGGDDSDCVPSRTNGAKSEGSAVSIADFTGFRWSGR